MNAARQIALQAYCRLTGPLRARELVRRQRAGTVPICILFYHRVADWCPNAWTMRTQTFQRQIEWLQDHVELIPLSAAQQRIADGTNNQPAVCITFDDGYADNFDIALPLLLREKIPFTYFVASQHVLKGLAFPHDAQSGYHLRPNHSAEIQLLAELGAEIGSHTRTHADLGPSADRSQLQQELVGSKQELEELIGREVRFVAFPYGMPDNMSGEAFRMAYSAGYAGVCSAYGAYNLPGDDPFHLRRIHADEEFIRLKNWVSFDLRKLRRRDLFDPGDYRNPSSACEPEGPHRELPHSPHA